MVENKNSSLRDSTEKEDEARIADRKRSLRKDYRILKGIAEFDWVKQVSHVTAPFKQRSNQEANESDRYMLFGNLAKKTQKQMLGHRKTINF